MTVGTSDGVRSPTVPSEQSYERLRLGARCGDGEKQKRRRLDTRRRGDGEDSCADTPSAESVVPRERRPTLGRLLLLLMLRREQDAGDHHPPHQEGRR